MSDITGAEMSDEAALAYGAESSRIRSQSRAETMTALAYAYISLHDAGQPMMAGKVRDALKVVLAGIAQEYGPWDEIAQ